MFQQLPFPAQAISDVRELVELSETQLRRLNELIDAPEAVIPIEQSFVERVVSGLNVDETVGESIVGTVVSMQKYGFKAKEAELVVSDMRVAISRYAEADEKASLLEQLDAKASLLSALIHRKPVISREMRRRNIQTGTQPSIRGIRTLVQLRPLFEEDEDGEVLGIECLVPSMTLELKYEKNESEHTATFSLDDEALETLMKQLLRAKSKWQLMHEEYHSDICE